MTKVIINSPLKWLGGKSKIANIIAEKLTQPTKANRLIEPFVGGASIFLNTDFPEYLLADLNPDSINFYKTVKENGYIYIDSASDLFCQANCNKKAYTKLKNEFNRLSNEKDSFRKATLFLYLNKFGFNGLCRYNQKGEFNAGYGHFYKHGKEVPSFPRAELLAFYKKSKRATFVVADFRTILKQATDTDAIYCDPPYVPLTLTANFTGYTSTGFNEKDHQDLAYLSKISNACAVVISNHDTPLSRELYKDATSISSLMVGRNISSKGAKREPVKEIIASYDKKGKVCQEPQLQP